MDAKVSEEIKARSDEIGGCGTQFAGPAPGGFGAEGGPVAAGAYSQARSAAIRLSASARPMR